MGVYDGLKYARRRCALVGFGHFPTGKSVFDRVTYTLSDIHLGAR
jgi:hypothetical protein